MTNTRPSIAFTKVRRVTTPITYEYTVQTTGQEWGEFYKPASYNPIDPSTWKSLVIRPNETTNAYKDDLFEIWFTGTPDPAGTRGTRLITVVYTDSFLDSQVVNYLPEETWISAGDILKRFFNQYYDKKPTFYSNMFLVAGTVADFDPADTEVIQGTTVPKPVFVHEFFMIEVMTKCVYKSSQNLAIYTMVTDTINVTGIENVNCSLTMTLTQYNISSAGDCTVQFFKDTTERTDLLSPADNNIYQGDNDFTFSFDVIYHVDAPKTETYYIKIYKNQSHKQPYERILTISFYVPVSS